MKRFLLAIVAVLALSLGSLALEQPAGAYTGTGTVTTHNPSNYYNYCTWSVQFGDAYGYPYAAIVYSQYWGYRTCSGANNDFAMRIAVQYNTWPYAVIAPSNGSAYAADNVAANGVVVWGPGPNTSVATGVCVQSQYISGGAWTDWVCYNAIT